MVNGVVLTMLTVETISDIKSRKVSFWRLLIFLMLGAVINIFIMHQPLWSVFGGMGIGAILFLYALASRESIGYGDCLIFVCAGVYLGFSKNLRLLFFSLLCAAIIGGIYVLVRKKKMKSRIPFVPFILGTYIVMTIWEIVGRYI